MKDVFKRAGTLASLHKQNLFLFIVVLLLLPLFTFFVLEAVHSVDHILTNNEAAAVEHSFKREMETTLARTKAAVQESSIGTDIANNNVAALPALFKEFAATYSLTGMVAVDKNGVALLRLASPKKGDYVGLTTPWGHEAMQGNAVTTMGVGRALPLLINSAVPIMSGDDVAGALIGSQILNNAYALRFAKEHLRSGGEIAFYSTKDGIYGNSFADAGKEHLLNIFFNKGSDAIQGSISGRIPGHFLLGNTLFHVENIKIQGLDGNIVGGILLFSPMRVVLFFIILCMSGSIALLLLTLLLQQQHRTKKFVYKIGIVGIAVLVVVSSGTLFYRDVIKQSVFKLIQPPFTIYNSTIELSPDADMFDLTNEQRITIKITSGGESINAAQAVLQYDPMFARVEDILMDTSFCNAGNLIEKSIDNQKGEVVISCIKPNGFFADKATLAELLIQPIRTGQFNVRFGPDTQVLANDGLGTNVLRTMGDGSYRIVDPRTGRRETAPALFSQSHPNAARWYSNTHVSINWDRAVDNESFAYAFDQTPDTIPDGTQVTVNTYMDIAVQKDGIYYFHLSPQYTDGTGPTRHLKVMIDTTPPYPPNIKSSATDVRSGEIVRFQLSNNGDNLSGLQKNFYVQFDDGILLPSLPQLSIPFLKKGVHKITVRVFDNAENISDSSTEITVH